MWCMNCNKNLFMCTCRTDEELKDISNIVAVKWCKKCNKHYSKCECEHPDFAVLLRGNYYPLPQDLT